MLSINHKNSPLIFQRVVFMSKWFGESSKPIVKTKSERHAERSRSISPASLSRSNEAGEMLRQAQHDVLIYFVNRFVELFKQSGSTESALSNSSRAEVSVANDFNNHTTTFTMRPGTTITFLATLPSPNRSRKSEASTAVSISAAVAVAANCSCSRTLPFIAIG